MNSFIAILFWFSIAAVAYSYALYPAVLAAAARLAGRRWRRDESHCPTVGVVVPMYNEEKVAHRKIDNLRALDYPADKLAIWIGSDCSTDATHDIIRGMGDPRIKLWIAPKRGGKTEVINHLTPQVDAEIILFTDANTMHRPDSLRRLVASFADPAVGAVAGHIDHIQSAGDRFGERVYRSFEAQQKEHEALLHSTISAFGGFYAVRKELFRPIPRNAYSNDDVLIPMNVVRSGKRVVFDASAVSSEDMTEAIRSEFQRRIRIGAGNFQAFFWLLDFLNPMRGWPWFCYVSHKVTRWFSPICMGIAFFSAIALALLHAGAIYSVALGGMLLFMAAGLSSLLIPARPLRFVFYFISMNVALVLGLFRYLSGIQSAAWSRTERVSS